MLGFITVSNYLLISTPGPPPPPIRAFYILSIAWWLAESLLERSIHFHPIDARLDQGMSRTRAEEIEKYLKAEALRGTMHSR